MPFLQVPGNEYFEASGDLGNSGKPKRVYFVSMLSEANTGAVLTLRNGTATGDSAFVTLNGVAGSGSVLPRWSPRQAPPVVGRRQPRTSNPPVTPGQPRQCSSKDW